MSGVIIRRGEQKDLEAVMKMQMQWEEDKISYGFTAADKNYLQKKLGEYFFVAEKGRRIIGFAYGSIASAKDMAVLKNGEAYIEIDDIYVSKDSRDKGVGAALLDSLLEAAKKNDIKRSLVYSSSKDMDGVLEFYRKHDYKTWYIQMFK